MPAVATTLYSPRKIGFGIVLAAGKKISYDWCQVKAVLLLLLLVVVLFLLNDLCLCAFYFVSWIEDEIVINVWTHLAFILLL